MLNEDILLIPGHTVAGDMYDDNTRSIYNFPALSYTHQTRLHICTHLHTAHTDLTFTQAQTFSVTRIHTLIHIYTWARFQVHIYRPTPVHTVMKSCTHTHT